MTHFYDPAHHDPSLSRRPQNRRDDTWIRELLLRAPVGRVATLWQGEDGEGELRCMRLLLNAGVARKTGRRGPFKMILGLSC